MNNMTTSSANAANTLADIRQRFYFENSPVRGDAVRLSRQYATIITQKNYPESIKRLLGEMLTAASLFIGTLKIKGRLSIQLQSSDDSSLLNWAMAECDHQGNIRGLASWQADTIEQQQAWQDKTHANHAFAELGEFGKGVLFINIQPETGQGYQGIVERCHDSLAKCLEHYQTQSAQLPTVVELACDGLQAGGLMLQKLPLSEQEQKEAELKAMSADIEDAEQIEQDADLWTRLTVLTRTIKTEELTKLTINDILYRLYHEELLVTPEAMSLQFACTCSQEKCETAIKQLGQTQALAVLEEQGGSIDMDCGFCGKVYQFNPADIEQIFA